MWIREGRVFLDGNAEERGRLDCGGHLHPDRPGHRNVTTNPNRAGSDVQTEHQVEHEPAGCARFGDECS